MQSSQQQGSCHWSCTRSRSSFERRLARIESLDGYRTSWRDDRVRLRSYLFKSFRPFALTLPSALPHFPRLDDKHHIFFKTQHDMLSPLMPTLTTPSTIRSSSAQNVVTQGLVRFVGGLRVPEFIDRKLNPRLLLESQCKFDLLSFSRSTKKLTLSASRRRSPLPPSLPRNILLSPHHCHLLLSRPTHHFQREAIPFDPHRRRSTKPRYGLPREHSVWSRNLLPPSWVLFFFEYHSLSDYDDQ